MPQTNRRSQLVKHSRLVIEKSIVCGLLSAVLTLFLTQANWAFADTATTNQIGQGVVYKRYSYDNLYSSKQKVFVVEINLNDPAPYIRFPYRTNGATRTISQHAATVPGAIACVNGQFGNSSGSIQFLRVSNVLVNLTVPGAEDEQGIIDDGAGNTNSVSIVPRPAGGWISLTAANVFSSGPPLITEGVKLDQCTSGSFCTRNPRTAAAWTYDNHLVLFAIDGRSSIAAGMSLEELRDYIYSFGPIRSAVNYDGGGSTDMWITNSVVNVPSDGTERSVVNAIAVVSAPPAIPATPTGLTATSGVGLVSLTWNVSSGAMSYNLKRSTTNGGPYSTIVNTATTSYTNTGLAQGATFYYVVSAVNLIGESSNSTQVAVTILGPPPAPGNLTATPGDRQVTLGWNAVAGASSYHVKRAATNGGPYTIIANLASPGYNNAGLVNGKTYYYVVAAVNSMGEGTNSSQVFATPQCVVPAAPASMVAAMTNGQIALGWASVSGATSYAVYRSAGLTGPFTALVTNLNANTYLDTSAVSGTVYFYIVRAANSCGASADSDMGSAPLLLTSSWVAGTNLVLSGWGGVAGRSFYLLGSPNLAVPAPQWTRLATNSFGPSGSISVTNALSSSRPQQFYLIQIAPP
jgi:fibronectin type 3 domain-containing protein